MSEVAQGTQEEFWRPPSPGMTPEVLQTEPVPAMAEVCPRCSTEFLLGARFCHTCGIRRPIVATVQEFANATAAAQVWEGLTNRAREIWNRVPFDKLRFRDLGKLLTPGWLHYLHFHEIRTRMGLSTASLIAFVLGLVCVAGALLVGLLTVKTFVDWQAIQMYRIEWLLAATAAFVAGILLKKNSRGEED